MTKHENTKLMSDTPASDAMSIPAQDSDTEVEMSVVPLQFARQLERLARNFRTALLDRGEWDDGCFYFNGISAPQFEGLLKEAEILLK
jgi:hypothetical protein